MIQPINNMEEKICDFGGDQDFFRYDTKQKTIKYKNDKCSSSKLNIFYSSKDKSESERKYCKTGIWLKYLYLEYIKIS